MKFIFNSIIAIFITITFFSITKCTAPPRYKYVEGWAFSTTYHIVYQSVDQLDYKPQIDSILDQINRALSVFDSTSLTCRINTNQSSEVNPVFRKAFEVCKLVSDSSLGAFDVTVAPLINSWGFGKNRRSNLAQSQIDSLLKLVNYHNISIQNGQFTKSNPAISINMSSVGDGLAVDEVVAFLEKKQITNYMVEIGGEVKARGINAKQMPWKIGIDKPIFDSLPVDRPLEQIVAIDNKALSTSGSYRKFFVLNGQKYSHFIDPLTGRPVTHNLLSATVIHQNCALADGFSTAFMVMGLQKSLLYLKNDTTLSAYFIYAQGDTLKVVTANGFERFMVE